MGEAGAGLAVASDAPGITQEQSDYLLIALFSRLQHLRFDDARSIVDGALILHPESVDFWFAKLVIEYELGNIPGAQAALHRCEQLEPAARLGSERARQRVRMRNYLKARMIHNSNGELNKEGRAALDFYLRETNAR